MPVHPPPPPLTTAEVAQLLGVKPATVYAYVSRGLLGSRRNGDGKNSLFDRREVDAFLAARKRPTTPGIRTGITLISDGTLHYRGHDAIALASVASFEEIVALLWTGTRRYETLAPDPRLLRLAEDVIAPLPGTARHTDRLRLIVAAAAAGDPLRFDTTPAAVIATSRALLGTMVAALPPVAGEAVGARGKPRSKGSAIEGLTSGGSELLFRDEMRTGLAESSGQEAVSDSGGPQATTAETGLGQAGVPDSEDGSADVASAGGGHAGTNGTSSTHTSTGDTSNTHTSTG
ncbi:helix-turn-helix domain-containing protein, partial [Paractinoplanes brasiliensis]